MEVQDGSKTYSVYGWNADESGETPGERGGTDKRHRKKNGRECTTPLPLWYCLAVVKDQQPFSDRMYCMGLTRLRSLWTS